MVTVRTVSPKEWRTVKAVRLRALADAPGAFAESLSEAEATPYSVWQDRIKENSEGVFSISFLAFSTTEPIGMAVGLHRPKEAKEARMVSMWVAPEYRGKNVADQLLLAVVGWARKSKVEKLVASVAKDNPKAGSFYQRSGFERMSERPEIPRQSASCQINLALDLDPQKERGIFPDSMETIEDLVAEGQKVAARHRFTGTQLGQIGAYPVSGRKMMAQYLAIYRLESGCIAEAWVEWNNLSGLIQLGHFVPPS